VPSRVAFALGLPQVPDKIRVLYFVSSFEQGGAERQVAELIRGLDRDRYEPRVAVCNTQDQLGYDLRLSKVTDLRAPMGPTPTTLMRLCKLLVRERPEVLHTFMGHQNFYGRLAAAMTRIGRAVGSVRCTRLSRKELVYEMSTRWLAHATIVNSVGIRDELVARARVPPVSIDVVENGVDTARFRPPAAEERTDARHRFGMRGTNLVLPGRLSRQKNQRGIVEALSVMRARGTLPADLTLHLAGREEASSDYGTTLRQAVVERGLTERVRFLGVIRDIEVVLRACDCLVLPSIYEGLPNAVLEAMSSGIPVVVAPPCNADALVRDGEEGLICADTTPDAIADTLERFLSLGVEARLRMGVCGREHAAARFTIPRMVARTCAVYERVLAARSRRAAPTAHLG
jgi:glycosyltransferase involved in cell wall biosynthesis